MIRKKTILGTANLGNSYGKFIKNFVNFKKFEEILNIMDKLKINYIDTAIAYNNGKNYFSKIKLDNFNVISKIQYTNNIKSDDPLKCIFERHINELNISSLYSLLLHNPVETLKSSQAGHYLNFLNNLKNQKIIKKIGISIYNPEDLKFCLENFSFDLVQLPMNIFDCRFLKTGWLKKLKSKNIEIHARSIFLQGMILSNSWPNYFDKWANNINNFYKDIELKNLSALEASIIFINNIREIDGVIIGVNNYQQLVDYNSIKEKSYLSNILFKDHSVDDENFINPNNWEI